MLDSDGCAVMYGGGFSEIVLNSRVNYFSQHCILCRRRLTDPHTGCFARHVGGLSEGYCRQEWAHVVMSSSAAVGGKESARRLFSCDAGVGLEYEKQATLQDRTRSTKERRGFGCVV